jgi:ribose transport system substrate-binding protein
MRKKGKKLRCLARTALTAVYAAIGMLSLQGCANEALPKGIKFGASYMTMNNPFYGVINDAIKDRIESNGDILITLDPALDQEKQVLQIEDMVSSGIEALFLTPVDWMGVKPALEMCKEAGVIVVNIDAPVYDEQLVDCIVSSDNYSAGALCAKDLISRLDMGNVVVITHPGAKSSIDRIAGFDDLIFTDGENYKELGRLDSQGQLENAMPLLEDLLRKTPDVDAVMALNDPSAQGAVAALNAMGFGPGDVLLYGVDGSPDVKRLIQDGWVTGTSAQSPINLGAAAVDAAIKLLNGEKVERLLSIPVEFITSSNVYDYGIDGWQ